MKPVHLLRRRNKVVGAAILEAPDNPVVPALPDTGRPWHPLTLRSWTNAWSSPMAPQWLPVDAPGLGRLATLWDAFYQGDTSLLPEIRLNEQRFGLGGPRDRQRLRWTLARSLEPAAAQTTFSPTHKRCQQIFSTEGL